MRTTVAALMGKTVAFLSRRFNLGGGTTFPGEIARRVDPRLLQSLGGRLANGCIVVTGTNGKTTTSRMITSVLCRAGLTPIHNRSGANLVEGIASALLGSASLSGALAGDVGVFEVDEATLPQVVNEIQPRALVVTNLFRDQLDRYGEIDYIAGLWRRALAAMPPSSVAILNADDPLVASLGADTAARVVYYGLEEAGFSLPDLQHAADSKFCLVCGARYQYEVIYYSHIGKYFCPNCGATRPQPTVYAEKLALHGTEGATISLALPRSRLSVNVGLPGIYNVYNTLAALACCSALDIPNDALQQGIESLAAAFGRIERIDIDGKQAFLALVKNPVGFNEVLHMLFLESTPKYLIIIVNDNIADGTDISWLWDVDFELLRDKVKSVIVSGTRAEDMQLRLKYAQMDMARVSLEKDLPAALNRGLERVTAGETLYVLPTYTAMLAIRRVIEEMGYVSKFWQD